MVAGLDTSNVSSLASSGHSDTVDASWDSKLILLLLAALLCWFVAYAPLLYTAVRTWAISEIFHHCFLVLPAVGYFFWIDRHKLSDLTLQPCLWFFPALLALSFLGVFACAGQIQVLGHIAAFLSLPVAACLVLGVQFAKAFYFPLLFVVFAIPLGEQFVPVLQTITAQLAVWILKLLNIPVFNNGLYIDIPAGSFVVAEACSGISFLIASVVFGVVFSHLGFSSLRGKLLFILFSASFPIIANALRVVGIILIGHYSDMQYATGADHIVYGWVFFSIVLFCLYLIGKAFGGNLSVQYAAPSGGIRPREMRRTFPTLVVVVVVFLLTFFWRALLIQQSSQLAYERQFPELDQLAVERVASSWQPQFEGATQIRTLSVPFEAAGGLDAADVYLAWYASTAAESELISTANRFYRKNYWSHASVRKIDIPAGSRSIQVQLVDIVSVAGQKRVVAYWYHTPLLNSANRVFVKLAQTMDIVLGGDGGGVAVAVSIPFDGALDASQQQQMYALIVDIFARIENDMQSEY